MQQAYLDICGVSTRVITYGKWVEESFREDEPTDIILCIPGNPGVTEFYCEFMRILHERLGWPVWIVGHAGHEPPPQKHPLRRVPALTDNERLYGLRGQVVHKQAFIEMYVPQNAKIHFIGHSVGAYMILELLKVPMIRSRVVHNYLLFPTIEYMSDTPNGKFMTKFVKYIIWLLVFLSWIFIFLPYMLQSLLIQIYTTYYHVAEMHLKTIIKFIRPDTLSKVFYLGLDEMAMVRERNNDVLIENKNIITLYYGLNDRWAPQSYCMQLKKDIPNINAQICKHNYEHAFVLRYSVEVANMVADWVEKRE